MIISHSDLEDINKKRVGHDCIREPYLANIVEYEGDICECDYSGEEQPCITLEELADRIEAAFEDHFSRTAQEPDGYESAMMRDREIDYEWYREGQETKQAIADAAQVSEEIASDVQSILEDRHYSRHEAEVGEEGEFSEEAHYEEIMPKDERWHEEWNSFERSIKTEARFFSRTAASHLSRLFDQIDQMRTRDNRSLVVRAGPDTEISHLYRGRVFQNGDALERAMARPDLELSAPPAWAASAGRMNARGISVFYGATAPEIALAEVRPPVGSRVAVGRFEIIRPLVLMDLTALDDLHESGSIFDPSYASRLTRMMFLRTLCKRMARPVMPDDQELEYLPTQAIADYLSTESSVPLDGIFFPSVQIGGTGLNAVLFHKAARTEELDIPEGTKISASTYSIYGDGPEPDFTVIEKVPPVKEDEEIEEEHPWPFGLAMHDWTDWRNVDHRENTLRFDTDSLRIHEVGAIQISTSSHSVRRHHFEKREPPF